VNFAERVNVDERQKVEQAMAALEAQRPVLGDEVVEVALAALRGQLAQRMTAPAGPQRKQATILFADISGFTALAEQMDAEEVTQVVNGLWQRLDRVIVEHHGRIDKHMGDAVMAIWGAAEAGEDDSEQAIRAALAMQREVAAFRVSSVKYQVSSKEEKVGAALSVRIGVNTGPVLWGQVGTTGEFTVMGDTVNVANRLEKAAEAGGILISHDTLPACAGGL
jgi:class 3 adenylate cyclase